MPARRSTAALLATMALRQHRVVAGWQARRAGLRARDLARFEARGGIHEILDGVFALGTSGPGDDGEDLAAVLACGRRGGALSHRSALARWIGFDRPAGPRHVTVTHGLVLPEGIRDHRHRRATALHVVRRGGVPTTGLATTLAAVAGVAPPALVAAAVREAAVRRLLTPRVREATVAAVRGRPGAALLRDLVRDEPEPLVRSHLERDLLPPLLAAGAPRPLTGAHVDLGPDGRREADLVWPRERVVVLADGWEAHGNRLRWEDDHDRDAAFVAAGFRVVPVTWRALRDRPEAVVRRVLAALRHGGAASGAGGATREGRDPGR